MFYLYAGKHAEPGGILPNFCCLILLLFFKKGSLFNVACTDIYIDKKFYISNYDAQIESKIS